MECNITLLEIEETLKFFNTVYSDCHGNTGTAKLELIGDNLYSIKAVNTENITIETEVEVDEETKINPTKFLNL